MFSAVNGRIASPPSTAHPWDAAKVAASSYKRAERQGAVGGRCLGASSAATHRVDCHTERDKVDLLVCSRNGLCDEDAHGSSDADHSSEDLLRSFLLRSRPERSEVTDLQVPLKLGEQRQLFG